MDKLFKAFDRFIDFLLDVITHKRMKSLYWRVFGMGVAELGAVIPYVMADYEAPQWAVIGFGLVFSEITKHLNSKP